MEDVVFVIFQQGPFGLIDAVAAQPQFIGEALFLLDGGDELAGLAQSQGILHRLVEVFQGIGLGHPLGLEIIVEHLDDLQQLPAVDAFAGIGEQRGADQGEGRDHGNLVNGLDDAVGQVLAVVAGLRVAGLRLVAARAGSPSGKWVR